MRKRFFAIFLLFCLALAPVHGEDDTLKNVYQSLSRFGNNVRSTFTEDSRDHPTPKRHRKSVTRHLSSKETVGRHSDSSDASPSPTSSASSKTSESKSVSASSTEAKKGASQADTGSEKPDSNAGSTPGQAGGVDSNSKPEMAAPMATLKPEALREFFGQPPEVQRLIRNSLALTEQNLGYKYGSADPAAGGMDCSGFIYYVLSNAGFKDVPRDSAGQYVWARKNSNFYSVLSQSAESFELDDLRPGDLLFWSGTYKVDREIPITHVMIYLGKEKATGKAVMVGATDGRTYDGVRRYGVSVFDFKMPSGKPNKDDPGLTAKFEGYASIPGLREADAVSKNQGNLEQRIKSDKETPNVEPDTKTLGDGD
jgi:peptidoglycan DL-endopeptidase CwlO